MLKSILEVARQADLFFMQASPIHETMRRLARIFTEMDIPFAIAGAMATNAHGHMRTTADVDILIRKEDLERFKAHHLGLGWADKFEGSKNFRDAVTNVNVDALLVGDFPGDGLSKPISFPAPEAVAEVTDENIPVISLKCLIELKLASGMTAPHRPRDFDDVIQLIRIRQIKEDFCDSLNPYVVDKFRELWRAAQTNDDY